MKYLYLDGDNIGQTVSKLFMDNDEIALKTFTSSVEEYIKEITKFLQTKNIDIIFSGADGIIGKGYDINGLEILDFARKKSNDVTFSIGVGNSLRNSFVALKYAKSSKKNVAVELIENQFIIQK